MKDKTVFFLKDIQNSLNKILKYTNKMSYQDFVDDEKTRDAVERNFEIIGEAVKKLPKDFRDKYPNIPFRQIAGMRDKLIHDYFGIDYEIIWKTIKDKLPEFNNEIKILLSFADDENTDTD